MVPGKGLCVAAPGARGRGQGFPESGAAGWLLPVIRYFAAHNTIWEAPGRGSVGSNVSLGGWGGLREESIAGRRVPLFS